MLDLSTLTNSAGAGVLALALWAGASYVVAPEVGLRLVTKQGEIGRCAATLRTKAQSAIDQAVAALPKPAPTPDVGKTFRNSLGMVLGHLPNSEAFMDRYGGQIERYGARFAGPVEEKFAAAKRDYDEAVARLRRAGELQINAAGGHCDCLARTTINSPSARSSLSWHVGTFGLVKDAPLTDWQTAFHRPEITAQCRGVS